MKLIEKLKALDTKTKTLIILFILLVIASLLRDNSSEGSKPNAEKTVFESVRELHTSDVEYDIEIQTVNLGGWVSISGWNVEYVYFGENPKDQVRYIEDKGFIKPGLIPTLRLDKDPDGAWGGAESYTAILYKADENNWITERRGITWVVGKTRAPRVNYEVIKANTLRLTWQASLKEGIKYKIYEMGYSDVARVSNSIPREIGQTTNGYFEITEVSGSKAYAITSCEGNSPFMESSLSNIIMPDEYVGLVIVGVEEPPEMVYEVETLPVFVNVETLNGTQMVSMLDYTRAELTDNTLTSIYVMGFGTSDIELNINHTELSDEELLQYLKSRQLHILSNTEEIKIPYTVKDLSEEAKSKDEYMEVEWKIGNGLISSQSVLEHYLKIKASSKDTWIDFREKGMMQAESTLAIRNIIDTKFKANYGIKNIIIDEKGRFISVEYHEQGEERENNAGDERRAIIEQGGVKMVKVKDLANSKVGSVFRCTTLEDIYLLIVENDQNEEVEADLEIAGSTILDITIAVTKADNILRQNNRRIGEMAIHPDYLYVKYKSLN